ncbi:Polyphosphate kinase 2 (PPK2) [Azotobacter beijerinckii]|uniref:Polyphosphate kinase 2 (PPK2) n=1 Tax=Azotobacter beijerinckii TaxID=170623 RepID=A0A1H6ZPQ5_9GAMM|nr:Polyphosphate kinase 2 (PPK2) [Azotobacter beijerinckii]SEJ54656.1 Polyphosphate kinase 2 (PPK2) [Azotobacter beijerinckii]
MLERSHIPEAPWWIVEAVDKKRARLNCIHHLLGQVPYGEVDRPAIALPERVYHPDYLRAPPGQGDFRAGGVLSAKGPERPTGWLKEFPCFFRRQPGSAVSQGQTDPCP